MLLCSTNFKITKEKIIIKAKNEQQKTKAKFYEKSFFHKID